MLTLAEVVASRFRLGTVTGPPVEVTGGLLNCMWRVTTSSGSYAVKELNLERDWTADFDAVFALELAVYGAGQLVPRPVPDPVTQRPVVRFDDLGASVLVHHWVEARPVTSGPVSTDFGRQVGATLAAVHRLNVAWPRTPPPAPMPTDADWQAIAQEASLAGLSWADQVVDSVAALARIGGLVEEWASRGDPTVVSHRDVGQKNLLDRGGRPIVVDWEASGPVTVAEELGSTGLVLASGSDLVDLQPEVFAATVAGYVNAGGEVPEPGAHWFSMWFSNWTHFLRWNIRRCIDGPARHDRTPGPDLAVADDVVRRGLIGLPETLRRLDDLVELVTVAART